MAANASHIAAVLFCSLWTAPPAVGPVVPILLDLELLIGKREYKWAEVPAWNTRMLVYLIESIRWSEWACSTRFVEGIFSPDTAAMVRADIGREVEMEERW